ncbi:hypothetical protein Tco_0572655 [Tanacetum coccineum]
MESSNSNSQERELYQLQQMQHKAKESCMKSFRLLQSHLQVLSYNDLKINGCFERAFATLFEQDVQTFTGIMLLNLDQLEKQLDKDEFQGDRSMAAFCVINKQFQMFIDTQSTSVCVSHDSQMTEKYFAEYTGIEVKQFRETLLLHMGNVKKSLAERTRHKRQYDRRMNERQMQSRESKVVSSKALDASLVVTECSGTKSDKHDTSSSSRTYITHAVDVDIRPVNDQVPFAEVQLTAQHNVPANEQQHTEQSEPIYDTYLLEKVDSNNTPDSTNMCHRGGEIDQDAEQYQAKSPLLKAELVKSKEMIEKETYNELSRRFLLLEKHCISLEISIQHKEESFQSNKPCKNQDAPEFREFFEINDLKAQLQAKTTLICNLKNQIKSVKDASNEAKIAIGQRFSPKKSSAVHEKPNTPRSCLRWKPTGRIFKIAGLRWIPTGKMFTSSTTKASLFNDKWRLLTTLQAPFLKEKKGLRHKLLSPGTISSGLVPQPPSPTPNVPPTKNDWDSLFCPMFDEYFNPSPSVVQHVLVAVVQEPVVSTGTPSSTRIDQDTPSTSTSQTTQEEQSHVISTSVEEDDHGIEVAHMDNDL